MEGNLPKAQQMLEDDFKVKHTIYYIVTPARPLLSHTKVQSYSFKERMLVEAPLEHLLLHTHVLPANYRTYMIVAKFFIRWKKYNVGRKLMDKVFFFLNVQNNYWKANDSENDIGRSALIRILHNKHLQKLLIENRII